MLVEPIPVHPFRRGGRLATILLVIGPIALIVFPATQPPPDAAPQTSDSQANVVMPSAPQQQHSIVDAKPSDGFPGTAFGLPVRTVAATLEAGVMANLDGDLVAVSGYLSRDPAEMDCIIPVPVADESPVPCPRLIVVIDHPGYPAPPDPSLPPSSKPDLGEPHLEASIPPDSALAAALGPVGGNASQAARSVAVILIGRLGRPTGSCVAAAGWCRGELAIQRVAWAGGQWRNWVIPDGPEASSGTADVPDEISGES